MGHHVTMLFCLSVASVIALSAGLSATPMVQANHLVKPYPDWVAFAESGGSATLYYPFAVDVFGIGNHTYAIVTAGGDNSVRVMDITDPANPVHISVVFDDLGGFGALHTPLDVDVFGIDNRTYAIVTAHADNGVQIIDLTDPADPVSKSSVTDDLGWPSALRGPIDVDVFGLGNRTYAAVAAQIDDGVQIIDLTDPAHPTHTSAVFDGSEGFDTLHGARSVEVFGIDNRTYAIVGSMYDDGVQIIDLTDPAHPTHTSAVFDGSEGFDALNEVWDVDVFGIDNRTYAIVTAYFDGFQIIDITDPVHPVPTSAVFNGSEGFDAYGPLEVEVFGIDNRTYAIMTSATHRIQIMDITDPTHPVPTSTVASTVFDDPDGSAVLVGLTDVEVFGIDNRTYAIIPAYLDGGVHTMDITDPTHPVPASVVFGGS